jgi:Ca2+-binding RTX toxin-like protein
MKITGTGLGEIIAGGDGDDLIEGLGGNDTIDGFFGDDELLGGDGNDVIRGGYGDDIMDGGDGADSLSDESGNDAFFGGEGNDSLLSTGGSDYLEGGGGHDLIQISRFDAFLGQIIVAAGGDGNDIVQLFDLSFSQIGIDTGAGDDIVQLDQWRSPLAITLGTGSDLLILGAMQNPGAIVVTDFETGASGDRLDWLDYLAFNLQGFDYAANPFATGHARVLQNGADTLFQIDRDGAGATFGYVTLITFKDTSAASFTYENLGGYPGDGTIPAGLTLTGTIFGDRLVGAAGGDLIEGLDGFDILAGRAGDDTLRGGAGADQIDGELGNDILEGGADADFLDGGLGNDQLRGEDGNDTLVSSRGSDVLEGGAGRDLLSIGRAGGTDSVTANGGDDDDRILLSSQAAGSVLAVDGGAGNDQVSLSGLGWNAEVTLGTGVDTLSLNTGFGQLNQWGSVTVHDFATGDSGDVIDWDPFLVPALSGAGWDGVTNPFSLDLVRLFQSGADTLLQVNSLGWKTIVTFKNSVAADFTTWNMRGFPPDGSPAPGMTFTGTPAADTLRGSAGPDLIEGLDSNDQLLGGQGGDTIRGGEGNDRLDGQQGNDRLEGDNGNDNLIGGDGDDELHGGEGNDSINGFNGVDLIYGEGGDDSLSDQSGAGEIDGGSGNDTIDVSLSQGATGLVALRGGGGDDRIWISGFGSPTWDIEGGSGNDKIILASTGNIDVELGTGVDTLFMNLFLSDNLPLGPIAVQDFTTGMAGDRLYLEGLFAWLSGWDHEADPFAAGFARFVQSGADTLLQVDRDGGGASYGYQTVLTMKNVTATSLTVENRGYGTNGNDVFRLEQGADDAVFGGAGNDAFLFGGALTAGDLVYGGAGADQLGIQGNYSMRLGEGNLLDIETLALLSGSDTRFGDPGTNFYSYNLTMVDENVAPGKQLKVNYNGLRVGENVTFNGSDETDGTFFIFAGRGDDVLTGGEMDDAFYFGAEGQFSAADRIDGGGGRDQLGLRGNYNVTFGAATLTSIESLALLSGQNTKFGPLGPAYSYVVATHDDNVAAGQQFSVNAAGLTPTETVTFDGSAETNGTFRILSGQANDSITGGTGDDFLHGSLGADYLKGGGGADTYFYRFATESTGPNFDRIDGFVFGTDRLDMPGTHDSYGQVSGGTLSTAGFDADLAAAMAGALDPMEAIFFTPNAGDQAGKLFLIVDQNGTAGYQSGQDFVIELVGTALPSLPPPDFIV